MKQTLKVGSSRHHFAIRQHLHYFDLIKIVDYVKEVDYRSSFSNYSAATSLM